MANKFMKILKGSANEQLSKTLEKYPGTFDNFSVNYYKNFQGKIYFDTERGLKHSLTRATIPNANAIIVIIYKNENLGYFALLVSEIEHAKPVSCHKNPQWSSKKEVHTVVNFAGRSIDIHDIPDLFPIYESLNADGHQETAEAILKCWNQAHAMKDVLQSINGMFKS